MLFGTSLLNYVLSCPTCFVPNVLSYPTCLVPYVPSASRASCPTCSRASCPTCPTCSRALRASCPTCLVSYVASWLVLYKTFFLTYPIGSITLKLRSVFINNMDIFELFETKYENIYIRNCKLHWYRRR